MSWWSESYELIIMRVMVSVSCVCEKSLVSVLHS